MKKSLALFMVLLLVLGSFGFSFAVNTGPLPENCVKIDDIDGNLSSSSKIEGKGWFLENTGTNITLTNESMGVNISVTDFTYKDEGDDKEDVGFSWVVNIDDDSDYEFNGVSVKAGSEKQEEEAITISNVSRGTLTTDNNKGISNIVFCFRLIERPVEDPEYKIEVTKEVHGGDSGVEFDFTINKLGEEKEPFTLENQESEEFIIEEEDMKSRFIVEEINMPEGYQLKEIETDAEVYTIDGSKITFFVDEDESINIKFINEKIVPVIEDETYNITVTKEVYSGSSLTDFNFTINRLGEDNEIFVLRDGQSKLFEDVEEGTYILTEIMPSGYRLRGIETDVENVKDGNEIIFEVDGESVEITYVNELIPRTPTDDDDDDDSDRDTTTTRRDREDDSGIPTTVTVEIEKNEEEIVIIETEAVPTSIPVLDEVVPLSIPVLPQTGQTLPLTPFFGAIISAIGIYFKRQ